MSDSSNAPNAQDLAAQMGAQLDALSLDYQTAFAAAKDEHQLREENAKVLGKKGSLTAILKDMGKVPGDARKVLGERVNTIKKSVEDAFHARLHAIKSELRKAELESRVYDLTLPGRPLQGRGSKHPITQVRDEVIGIFRGLGFAVHDGREIDREENNFGKLGFPPDHPATDMQDSFWTDAGHVLRTHTSNIQVRAMLGHKPPMAFIAPGAVYRRDDDATHSPMFHQLEAFLIDKGVSMAHLRGVLAEFAARFFGSGTKVRLRPSYFPFVEPGAEVDFGCAFCRQDDGTHAGCNICKHTGWVEVLGCGMIHPVVLENCGINPEEHSGFALGMGLDRLAMLRFGIPHLRLMFENDPRFLAQF
jgi:phenylalanyl-tRNA synthetase alpha chain